MNTFQEKHSHIQLNLSYSTWLEYSEEKIAFKIIVSNSANEVGSLFL